MATGDFAPTDNEVWDCVGCSAHAPARFFETVEGRDDAMKCPDCGQLAYKVAGTFEL